MSPAPAGASTPAFHRNKKILTREDHLLIQQKCGLDGDKGEDYAAVFQRGKGYGQWSIHVFHRHPTQKEIDGYEQTASRVAFRGQKAKIEGSQTLAATALYNTLIDRSYDVLVGLKSHDQLNTENSRAVVPPLVKREAIRQLIGEVYSESRLAEAEGEEGDDDDPEGHTSDEPEGSGQ